MAVPVPNITKIPAKNYLVGRNGKPVVAIVLHQVTETLEALDAMACRSVPGGVRHTSFHFGIEGCKVHQYVELGDTALSFNGLAPFPTFPVALAPAEVDQSTINIALVMDRPEFGGDQSTVCAAIPYPSDLVNCIAKLVCWLSFQNNIPADAAHLLIDPGELPDFPYTEFVAAVNSCLNGTTDDSCSGPFCAPVHGKRKVGLLRGGIAMWDGCCLYEATTVGQGQVCDYRATLNFIDNGGAKINYIVIDGDTYWPPAPTLAAFPNAPAIQTWLNSLGLGAFAVNYVSGAAGGNFSVEVMSLASSHVVNSINYSANSFTNNISATPVASNCQTVAINDVPYKPVLSVTTNPGLAPTYDPATGTLNIPPAVAGGSLTTGQLCAVLSAFPTGAAALAGDKVLGIDCQFHALPAETPFVANDSSTVDFTTSGTNGHTLTGVVKVSAQAGNILAIRADGLYVPPLDVCAAFGLFGAAGVATTSTRLVTADCTIVTLPANTPLNAVDSSTIDFATSGTDLHTLTGTVKISSGLSNQLSAQSDGLYVPPFNLCITLAALAPVAPSVGLDLITAGCQKVNLGLILGLITNTPLVANDSSTVDFTTSGMDNHTLTATVKISAAAGNIITLQPDGLYVAPAAFNACVLATTPAADQTGAFMVVCDGAGNTTKMPVPTSVASVPLVAQDSSTVDFTTSGTDNHTLTATVKVSTQAGNVLTTRADGLYVPTPVFNACALSTTPAIDQVGAYMVVCDGAGNTTKMPIPASVANVPLQAVDSSTIDFATSGTDNHTVTATVKVSGLAGNQLTTQADGLYVPTFNLCGTIAAMTLGAVGVPGTTAFVGNDCQLHLLPTETVLVALDSTSIDFTSSGTNGHTVTATVKVSALAGNQLTTRADGLYVAQFDLCSTLAAMATGAAGVAGTTKFVGSDCLLHALPAETAFTATDSNSIDFTTSGTNGHTLTGAVKVSATAGNAITTNADGLYVPTFCTTVAGMATGAAGVAGTTKFVGSDCQLHALPAETALTATDSSTVDFTTSGTNGHTVTATVKVSATAGNTLVTNADGLYVPATALNACAVPDTPVANRKCSKAIVCDAAGNTTKTTVLVDATNGLHLDAGGCTVLLGGALTEPTIITVTDTNLLRIDGGTSTTEFASTYTEMNVFNDDFTQQNQIRVSQTDLIGHAICADGRTSKWYVDCGSAQLETTDPTMPAAQQKSFIRTALGFQAEIQGEMKWFTFPGSRNDLATSTPMNFIGTDATGQVKSYPLGALNNIAAVKRLTNAAYTITTSDYVLIYMGAAAASWTFPATPFLGQTYELVNHTLFPVGLSIFVRQSNATQTNTLAANTRMAVVWDGTEWQQLP